MFPKANNVIPINQIRIQNNKSFQNKLLEIKKALPKNSDIKKDGSVMSYTYKGQEYFQVKIQRRDARGKLRKKSSRFTASGRRITSKILVNQVKERLKRELDIILKTKSGLYTWEQWRSICFQKMKKEGLKRSTLADYERIINHWKDPEWDKKLISEINKEDSFTYFHDYLVKKGATAWTRKNLHSKIHRLFARAIEDGQIERNPTSGVKIHVQSEEGIAFTPKEVKTLLFKAKELKHEYYPHWVIALLTGLRTGELFALRYEKINFDSNTILIDEQFTPKDGLHRPKTGKIRTIDLGTELKEFLINLKKEIGPQSAKLWRIERVPIEVDEVIGSIKTGHKIMDEKHIKKYVQIDDLILPRILSWTRGNQAQKLRKFCQNIGIREARFHDLRATHITNLLNNGVSISKVMSQVGHSNISTTNSYHRLVGVEIRGITENLKFDIPKEE